MLTIFHVQNVLIILNWCLCDFLVLKHIDEVYALHLHLSFTDVDIFLCRKCSRISILFLIIYWFWLFFMCKMFSSFSIDVYVIFLYWNILMKCTHFIFISYLLMLTYFCVENVPEFQYCFWLFTDFDYFLCAKCSHHFRLMFMWFSCTETYRWSVCTSSSFLIYWCWHIFVSKMFQNFNIVFDYLLMLIIFPVQNGLIIFLSYSRISILLLIIYWCWLFFMCQSFFKKVSLSGGYKVSLRKFL